MSDNTFALSKPIHFEGKTYETLKLRPLLVKDLITMDSVQGGVRRSIAMYASICSVPLPVFAEMTGDDYARFMEAIQPFLGELGGVIVAQALAQAE